MEKKTTLPDDALDSVSGGAAANGTVITCKNTAPLYGSNPAGNQNRSTTNIIGTVQPNAEVRLYEYGKSYCKVISQGKIGWVETSVLNV